MKKYMVSGGISSKRILIEGKGPTEPIADNNNPETRGMNRRVEFEVLEF
ncbi:MAG: hypothetical protein ACK4ND_05930 [Cytophagaceae bacterium]